MFTARSAARAAARTHVRRQPVAARSAVRNLTTETPQAAPQAGSSHLVAGLAGGGLVLGALYGYYHYSGTAKVVATARSTIDTATSAKDKLISASPSPKDALDLLRSFAKTYVVAVPGAAGVIDQVFNGLEQVAETHGEKVKEITEKTYNDLKAAVADGKGGSDKIIKALQEAAVKIQELAGEKGGQLLDKLYETAPELKKVVGGGSEELQKLADKHGPEARRIAEDVYNQSSELIAKGGLNAKTYEAVRDLITQKTKEIKELAQKSGSDAWEASSKAAAPLLDKLPGDLKTKFDENVKALEGFAGEENVKVIKDMYAELEKISKSNKSAEDKAKATKELVESKIGSFTDLKNKAKETANSSGANLAAGAGAIPGLGALSHMLGGDELKHLKDIAEKHGDEAGKIFESTTKEVKELLAKKYEEAKKLGGAAKKDAEKEIKK